MLPAMSVRTLPLNSWRWPVLALVASLAMLGTAHGFERFAYMLPCELCLRQREVYWAVVAMAVTGLVLWKIRPARRFMTALNVMLGLVFVTGAVVAAYHAGVEWKWWQGPLGCSGGPMDPNAIVDIDLGNLDKPMGTVSCDEAPWHLLGLSMAGWNALISAGLAAISFVAAAATFRRPA